MRCALSITALFLYAVSNGVASTRPLIFPEPRQLTETGTSFRLNNSVVIAIPARPSPADLQLARIFSADLSDRYGLSIRTTRTSAIQPGVYAIVLGSLSNPLVKAESRRLGLAPAPAELGTEGYSLRVNDRGVLVAGAGDAGAFYGLQSLRQLIEPDGVGYRIHGVDVVDWPYKPFRGIYLYLPGRDNIPFFKRFVRDFMALYKFNKVILELNAAMRFDLHPELAAGWIDFSRDLLYTRRDRAAGTHGENQDSANADTADGGVLEKEEIADLVRYTNEYHVEAIPAVASLTHANYLLTRHRELAEITDAEWPDTYCPLKPGSYQILFDVMDEITDVFHPKMVLIGHDEWRMPLGVCPLCRGKDPTELFLQDVSKIREHLKQRNIRTLMWGDHLIESLRGKKTRETNTSAGYKYTTPGALSPAQVRTSFPKDILIGNWFWSSREQGPANEDLLRGMGMEQYYGNFTPEFVNWKERSAPAQIIGGAPSGWAATTELNIGKDLLWQFLGTANMLWSIHYPDRSQLIQITQEMMPEVRRNLSGQILPSAAGDPAVAVDFPPGATVVPIHDDVSSVIFQHAAARPASNQKVWLGVYNPPDTAALLGYYEVVYEDGYVDTVPIRYGVNILESQWPGAQNAVSYCYECAAPPSGSAMGWAYEWVNPRFGKPIQEIRLHQMEQVTDLRGRKSPADPVSLRAVKIVRKRSFPGPDRALSGDR
jgi:hexosaminidase